MNLSIDLYLTALKNPKELAESETYCQKFCFLKIGFIWGLKWAVIYGNKILIYGCLADPCSKSTYQEDKI